jgi:hypothetical protein
LLLLCLCKLQVILDNAIIVLFIQLVIESYF